MAKSSLTQTQKHISGKNSAAYKAFLKTFYSNVPKEDYEMIAPENLVYTAKRHLDMSEKRKVGKAPAIHITTPTRRKNKRYSRQE